MVSIIIPTYNRASLIGYTLASAVAAGSGLSIEIIVVDDNSTDNTYEVVNKNFPQVTLVKNRGKGAPAARNTGFSIAKGEYIVYLDSDDLIGENYFAKKIELMQASAAIDACYGEYDFFKSDGEFRPEYIAFKHKYPMLPDVNMADKHIANYLGGNFLPPNSIIWKKEFLQKIGGYDESLIVNQDVELVIRALFCGMQLLGVTDGTKVYIRDHTLDSRVGSTASIPKLQSILLLRKKIYEIYIRDNKGYEAYRRPMSEYLFNFWRSTRHISAPLAKEFLGLAKEVYWPIEIKGNIVYRTLAKITGPEKAVEIKYFLLKRD